MSSLQLIVPPELVVGALVLLATYALIQRGRLDAAIWLFIGLMLVPFVLATAIAVDPAAPVVLILPLVAAGMLLNRRSLTPILLIFVVTHAPARVNQSGTTDPIELRPGGQRPFGTGQLRAYFRLIGDLPARVQRQLGPDRGGVVRATSNGCRHRANSAPRLDDRPTKPIS